MIEITVPWKTPTINHLFWSRGHQRIMKTEARNLRKEIINITKQEHNLHNKKLKVTTKIYEDWFTKKDTVKRKDVMNREKFLIDSVFEGLEIDDKYIFEHTMKKIQSNEEYAIVKIEVLR